jgi:alanine dehydrogenase
MSEIAGRIAIQAGAAALQMVNGGRGVLLGGIPGVRPGKVVVLGAGIVGTEAMRMALGLGADVTIFDRSLPRLRELDKIFAPALKTVYSTPAAIEEAVIQADLVIGGVLIPGKTAPKLVTHAMVKKMLPGSVIVDVAIDQGGCIETSRPTTHSNPTFVLDGVVHYAVTNMPAACARTSTQGLTNATLPYALKIANMGYKKALKEDRYLRDGLNVYRGKVTNSFVADDLGYQYHSAESVLS